MRSPRSGEISIDHYANSSFTVSPLSRISIGRPSGVIELLVRVDAQRLVDGAGHVGRRHRPPRRRRRPACRSRRARGRRLTPAPANSSDAAGPQWSRPASLLIFGVRPNSPIAQHQRVGQQAAAVHVLDQGREALVELGQLLVQALEDLGVMVPAAVVDGDEAHAALDQPPGQQAALAEGVAAVAVAQLVALLLDGEGARGPRSTGSSTRPAAGTRRRWRSGRCPRPAGPGRPPPAAASGGARRAWRSAARRGRRPAP